ncbi:hypothetical protein SAMN05216312_102191 [Cohnella sp. OV330]|uniref:hypothetical protein n=1 Tax=Cohnella sp. OV330 TaxID=1855288 RepID=UPI0008F3E649|nr:hypothetical protein [Cohnella sp. OV330]SFA91153.1 hypothetical protein SAMN05216312_102191 [Cohnella sp. OV330]
MLRHTLPIGEDQVVLLTQGEHVQSLKLYQEDNFGEDGHGYQPPKSLTINTKDNIIALRDFLNQHYPPDET